MNNVTQTCIPFRIDLYCDGRVVAPKTRDGSDAPSAAAPPAPQCCPSTGPAAYATAGSPEGDFPCVPLSDWTGDCPGHCHSYHGDLPDRTSYAGTKHKTAR